MPGIPRRVFGGGGVLRYGGSSNSPACSVPDQAEQSHSNGDEAQPSSGWSLG